MTPCSACGAELETPLGCTACGALLSPAQEPTPFEVFGLEPAQAVETEALRKRLLRLSRVLHPDFFATDAEQRARAEQNSALLNRAYDVLSDDARRADWLVRHLGGPAESEQREMPQAFLMEVLEWNEALEEARDSAPGSPARAALSELTGELKTQRAATVEALAKLLTPLPNPSPPGAPTLSEARKQLNALRYLDRTLREIESLRLAQSAAT